MSVANRGALRELFRKRWRPWCAGIRRNREMKTRRRPWVGKLGGALCDGAQFGRRAEWERYRAFKAELDRARGTDVPVRLPA